jgi:hypothetical protein
MNDLSGSTCKASGLRLVIGNKDGLDRQTLIAIILLYINAIGPFSD